MLEYASPLADAMSRSVDAWGGQRPIARQPVGPVLQTAINSRTPMAVIQLQRTYGNAFVGRLVRTSSSESSVSKSAEPAGEIIQRAPDAAAVAATPKPVAGGKSAPGKAPGKAPAAAAGAPAKPAPTLGKAPIGVEPKAKKGEAKAEKAGAEEAKPEAKPEADPRFQGVMKRLAKTSSEEKSHEPADKKITDAQAAVQPPQNDQSSRAQANQVEVMDQAEAKKPEKESFLALLRQELERIAPKNMEETEEFKKKEKAGELKQVLSSNVGKQKEASASQIKGATQAKPDPSSVEAKEVVPMPEEAADKPPMDLRSKDVLPTPKPEAEISVEENKKSAEQMMADNDIDDEQLERANEPQCSEALEAKQELIKHADQVPETYRAEEESYLKATEAEVKSEEQAAKRNMRGTREKAKGKVTKEQEEAKKKEEEERKKVADKIQDMYETTKKTVEEKLNNLDGEVNTIFDDGEKRAREKFEKFVDEKMADYKWDRYIDRIGGSLLWAKDKLFGMPDEVNEFYEEGRDHYIEDMDAVLIKIADKVETRLKEAKDEIANGKAEIRKYTETLKGDLKKAAEDKEKDVSSQFDELESSVEDKKQDLAQKMAKRYQESREKLDERIKELQAENKGLVNAFIDKIKEIIKILREFKERVMGLLRKAADVIRQIIKDPIGFLKNLLAAVKLGFNQFVENILEHLKAGLIGWLFGTLASAGIEVPTEFSLKAVFGLVMQILGLTKDHIRAKLVKLIGAKNVEIIEKAWEVISTLIREGPAGLWEKIKEYLTNLKEMVIDGIRDWVITQIVKQAVLWVISLFNPASALLKAIQAIYHVVMFFVERIEQIMQLVEAVISSVGKIVAGEIGEAANWIEKSMARAVPLIISFLASLLGLGGIAEKIKSIISKIQSKVDAAVDKVLMKVVSKVKGLLKKVAAGVKKLVGKGKEKLGAIVEWWKARKRFKSADGEAHTIYFRGKEQSAALMVASNGKTIEAYVAELATANKNNPAAQSDVTRASTIVGEIKTITRAKTKTKEAKRITGLLTELSAILGRLSGGKFPAEMPKAANYDYSRGPSAVSVEHLWADTVVPGSIPSAEPKGWDFAVQHDLTDRQKVVNFWVRMHLVHQGLGGSGADARNLIPAPNSVNRGKQVSMYESAVLRLVKEKKKGKGSGGARNVVWLQTLINSFHPARPAKGKKDPGYDASSFASQLSMKAGLYFPVQAGGKVEWKKDDTPRVSESIHIPKPEPLALSSLSFPTRTELSGLDPVFTGTITSAIKEEAAANGPYASTQSFEDRMVAWMVERMKQTVMASPKFVNKQDVITSREKEIKKAWAQVRKAADSLIARKKLKVD
jgi:hypothetical protein